MSSADRTQTTKEEEIQISFSARNWAINSLKILTFCTSKRGKKGISASLEGAGGGDEAAAEVRRASTSLVLGGGLSEVSNQSSYWLVRKPSRSVTERLGWGQRSDTLLFSRQLAAFVERAGGAYSKGGKGSGGTLMSKNISEVYQKYCYSCREIKDRYVYTSN